MKSAQLSGLMRCQHRGAVKAVFVIEEGAQARVYRPPIKPSIFGKPRRSNKGTIARQCV